MKCVLRLPVAGIALLGFVVPVLAQGAEKETDAGFGRLFASDTLEGWSFSDWSDVSAKPKTEGPYWKLERGVLSGLGKHTWIFSDKEYGDFVLKFEGKISKGANSGVGLRFPAKGDPAYQGMEIQFVDGELYYHTGNWNGYRPEQLTGSIYDEIAAKQTMKPAGQWNAFEITCRGSQVSIVLNGQKVLEADLAKETKARQQKGPALAERSRKGRIGFQNLSGEVVLRDVMIKTLE